MKKLLLLVITLISFQFVNAQGFGVSISAGYLSEIDNAGYSADLLYHFNEKLGIATNATLAITELREDKLTWFATDLNAHYKIFDEVYVLAGGEYLSSTYTDRSAIGGFVFGESKTTTTDFGFNLGGGYKYNLVDNVNLFTEMKYVIIETGYFHARLGVQFDF
jgi:outer membrane immunogenic protein